MKCKACKSKKMEKLIDLGIQPIAHNYLRSVEENDSITHPLILHFCVECGFIQIDDPIPPEKLYTDYNFCFSAWKPEPHISAELELIDKYVGDKNVSILEVGCNDGVFIGPLISRGYKNVKGVEANSYAAERARQYGVEIINEMFNEQTAMKVAPEGGVNLIILRQVLEHIPDLDGFFVAADKIFAKGGKRMLFIEVPDFSKALNSADCSTIWEEHPNYFTKKTLESILSEHGYECIVWDFYNFSGGAMCVLAKKIDLMESVGKNRVFDLQLYNSFSDRVYEYKNKLVTTISSAREKGYKILLYGTGSRACTLVNGLEIGAMFDSAIDDQIEKNGLYMPGCKLPIHSFDDAMKRIINNKAIFLLAVNNENEEKVIRKIRECQEDVLIASLFSPRNINEELTLIENGLG